MATDQRTVIILHASLSEEAVSMIVGRVQPLKHSLHLFVHPDRNQPFQISWLGLKAMNCLSKHYMGPLHPLLRSRHNHLSKTLVLIPQIMVVATIIIEEDTKTLEATIIIEEEEGLHTANFAELQVIMQTRVQSLHHMRLLLLLWMTPWPVHFMLSAMSQALPLTGTLIQEHRII